MGLETEYTEQGTWPYMQQTWFDPLPPNMVPKYCQKGSLSTEPGVCTENQWEISKHNIMLKYSTRREKHSNGQAWK